jgi:hypothetical protein
MSALSSLFERFLRERRYLKNVTPKTVVWYQTAFLAFTRTVSVEGPDALNKPGCTTSSLVCASADCRPSRATPTRKREKGGRTCSDMRCAGADQWPRLFIAAP